MSPGKENTDDANLILICKKEYCTDLKNYRAVSLLSHLYKVITNIPTNRIKNQLEKNRRKRFETVFSSADRIYTLHQILKTKKFNSSL